LCVYTNPTLEKDMLPLMTNLPCPTPMGGIVRVV